MADGREEGDPLLHRLRVKRADGPGEGRDLEADDSRPVARGHVALGPGHEGDARRSPMSVPTQTRTVQGSPPGRRPSRSSIHRGTVATMRAAMPLGMVRSDHITRPLPTDSSRTPTRA